jgi:hypothetical protein
MIENHQRREFARGTTLIVYLYIDLLDQITVMSVCLAADSKSALPHLNLIRLPPSRTRLLDT